MSDGMLRPFLVFDVESVGLHGEGYAVGYVVVGASGVELESGRFACMPSRCGGTASGREWIGKNVPPIRLTHDEPYQVRDAFWGVWQEWKGKGAILAADCPWPVEARFLAACVDDTRPVLRGVVMAESTREWDGPYPLIDVASVRLAAGLDPLGSEHRLPAEMPAHDPLADARQSARLLVEALGPARRDAVPPIDCTPEGG